MASKLLRVLVPHRPAVRILLLLVVAGVAIGVAGALFSGGETAARDPVVTGTAPSPAGAVPAPGPSPEDDSPATAGLREEDAATADEATSPARSGGNDGSDEASAGDAAVPASGDEAAASTTPEDTSAPATPEDTSAPATGDDSPTEDTGAGSPEATASGANEPPAATTVNEPAVTDAAAQLIEQLRPLVADSDPSLPAYDRAYFAGWVDSDGDCVNTRHEILQMEAADFSMNAEGCAVASGEWFDPYTNRTFTDPRDLDVDHVVALADAWVSGAWEWADELLDRFSNDLGNLNAIAAGENRSKSAKGPAEYSPSAPAASCAYLTQYATVKIRWSLSITPPDFEVVATGLAVCEVGAPPDTSSSTPAASSAEAPPAAATTTSAAGCHPAYEPCLPNLPGDALNCGDLRTDQKPVTVIRPGTDPYRLDRDRDGRGCTS